jgi:hypothetical protein
MWYREINMQIMQQGKQRNYSQHMTCATDNTAITPLSHLDGASRSKDVSPLKALQKFGMKS